MTIIYYTLVAESVVVVLVAVAIGVVVEGTRTQPQVWAGILGGSLILSFFAGNGMLVWASAFKFRTRPGGPSSGRV